MAELKKHHRLQKWMRAGAFAALALSSIVPAIAFESQQIITIFAGTITGGTPPVQPSTETLKIHHAPPVQASAVTKQFILLGEAGTEVPPGLISFNSRRKPQSDPLPLNQRKVRVRVIYRLLIGLPGPGLSSQDVSTGTLTELPPIEGEDPTLFAFEIDRSSVTEGTLQYKIIAEHLELVGGNLVVVGSTTFPASTAGDPDPFVSLGVQANASQVFGVNGGRFTLQDANPEDGQTVLDIPPGALVGPTVITVDELPANSPFIPAGLAQPITVYSLRADGPVRGLMNLSLLYPDFEFPQGQDGIIDNTTIPETKTDIALWDGFMWRRLGGRGNFANNTLTVKVGALNFMAVIPAAPVSAEELRPMERIITPNGDTKNDSLQFLFNGLSENVRVEIFSTTGERVRTIYSSNTFEWDGRDDNGKVVESGVYIYQYELDGKRVSGLVAVAK